MRFFFRRDKTQSENDETARAAGLGRASLVALVIVALIPVSLGLYWSFEPTPFAIRANVEQQLKDSDSDIVIVATTSATLLRVAETL